MLASELRDFLVSTGWARSSVLLFFDFDFESFVGSGSFSLSTLADTAFLMAASLSNSRNANATLFPVLADASTYLYLSNYVSNKT